MSVFMVSEKTMHRVIAGLDLVHEDKPYEIGELVAFDHKDKSALGRALFAMNAAALKAGYGEEEDWPDHYTYKAPENLKPVQAYKAMRCLLYQCSEGDVPDTPLFRAMEICCAALGYQLHPGEDNDIPGYKQADWDTCANRGDGKHRVIGSDLGMLAPTVRGWICPFCDYTQNWAHDSMKQWKKPCA